jgi:medium-chain acyl-[acyl-carrier-protein] hydrolase
MSEVALALLRELEMRHVAVQLRGERLHMRAPKGSLDPNLRNRIEEHRSALIDELEARAWFFIPRRVSAPRNRLFCFHPAGGDGMQYRTWPEHLDDDVEVRAVNLPGRGHHPDGTLAGTLAELVERLEPVMQRALDVPFVCFGHSVGARIALEVVRRLEARGRCARALVVAACRPPGRLMPGPAELSDASTRRLLAEAGTVLDRGNADSELAAEIIRLFRADAALLETAGASREAVRCPILVMGGVDDRIVEASELSGWRALSERCEIELFAGGHMFTRSAEAAVVGAIGRLLR